MSEGFITFTEFVRPNGHRRNFPLKMSGDAWQTAASIWQAGYSYGFEQARRGLLIFYISDNARERDIVTKVVHHDEVSRSIGDILRDEVRNYPLSKVQALVNDIDEAERLYQQDIDNDDDEAAF